MILEKSISDIVRYRVVMILYLCLGLVAYVSASSSSSKDLPAQGYKDQYCTDPRTMRKHAAYTEWADAYSCSRHRCQPGGRNLAIYTVGCKRVEAPESAIECEEVVEDTNMQFPFCCTRLRCLVVVRGEVWTRVLGQPWEVLPAAPWSHMYKMKKPPPSDTTFMPKTNEVGPVYELSEPEGDSDGKHEKVPRSGRKQGDPAADCNEVVPRAAPLPAPAPDIVIALSTNNDKELNGKTPNDIVRHKRGRKSAEANHYNIDEDRDHHETDAQEIEEMLTVTEKAPEGSDEKFGIFSPKETPKQPHKPHMVPWTDIPQNQWNEHEGMEGEQRGAPRKPMAMELRYTQEPKQPEYPGLDSEKVEKKEEVEPKSKNLQSLVDAIGTRMKDIESVVQRMSEKVRDSKTPVEEKRPGTDTDFTKYNKNSIKEARTKYNHEPDADHASTDDDRFKPRYSPRVRETSKYLRTGTEPPADPRVDDTNYFSDPSNAVRRAGEPKEPPPSHATYMAPVENFRKTPAHVPDTSEDSDKKKKKRTHKKRKSKTHAHKKHHNTEKRKRFNKLNSVEIEKNGVSLEDSSAVGSK